MKSTPEDGSCVKKKKIDGPKFNNIHTFALEGDNATFNSQFGEVSLNWVIHANGDELDLIVKNSAIPEKETKFKFTFVPFKRLIYLFSND